MSLLRMVLVLLVQAVAVILISGTTHASTAIKSIDSEVPLDREDADDAVVVEGEPIYNDYAVRERL